MAETAPVVLVFEDMQWADEALLDFVEYLIEWSRDHRLFVIALPGRSWMSGRAGWAAARARSRRSRSSRCPARRWSSSSSGWRRGCRPTPVARIAAAAEGVPLYAVETVRMLLDRGVVVRADDGSGYRVTGAI